jgi:hypothetical protein
MLPDVTTAVKTARGTPNDSSTITFIPFLNSATKASPLLSNERTEEKNGAVSAGCAERMGLRTKRSPIYVKKKFLVKDFLSMSGIVTALYESGKLIRMISGKHLGHLPVRFFQQGQGYEKAVQDPNPRLPGRFWIGRDG